jgi:hypothetical protein
MNRELRIPRTFRVEQNTGWCRRVLRDSAWCWSIEAGTPFEAAVIAMKMMMNEHNVDPSKLNQFHEILVRPMACHCEHFFTVNTVLPEARSYSQ